MCPSRTVSEIDGDFSRKSQNFPTPLVFCDPAEGVLLRIGYRRWGQKTIVMGLPDRKRSLTISLVVWIQCINVTDGQTDGWTDGHRVTAKTARTHSVRRAVKMTIDAFFIESQMNPSPVLVVAVVTTALLKILPTKFRLTRFLLSHCRQLG